MLTALTAPAFAETWYIEDGDITISAGKDGNDVTQKGETTYGDKDTVITNHDKDTASSNTVTIDAKDENDKVEVTLKDVNIDTSKQSKAAVSVTGKGDTNIELDGDNELKSGAGHAGLEHNKTDTSGELTIQDKDKNGSLEAVGGFKGAGIGSAGSNDAQVKITGGNITATSDDWGAGIGSGSYGTGTVEITGGEINATGGYLGAGIGGGCNGSGNVTISGGTITAAGSDGAAGIGGGYYNGATVTITGDAVIKNASNTKYGAGIGGGYGYDGDVTISGNAKIENATGGYGAAGIGGGAFSSPDKIGNGNVVVCDGFTGNVILKLTEGVAKMLLGMLKGMFLKNLGGKLAYLLLKDSVSDLKHQMDSEEYGGAPFLGAKQPVIKAHGSSKAKGIKNAIRQAKICVENDLCGTMQAALDELNTTKE